MNKLVTFVISVLMLISLVAGCGGGGDSKTSGTTGGTTSGTTSGTTGGTTSGTTGDVIQVINTQDIGAVAFKTTDIAGTTVYPSNLSLDSQNNVYIQYLNTDNSIGYATNKSGSFINSKFTQSVSNGDYYTGLTIDKLNNINICYVKDRNIHLIDNKSGWTDSIIAGPSTLAFVSGTVTPTNLSIDTDANNKIHIGYTASGLANYLTNVSGDWISNNIYTHTFYPETYTMNNMSTFVDKNNKIHLMFSVDGNIYYSSNKNGSWITTKISTTNICTNYGQSLAVDNNGAVHIVYYSLATPASVYYVTNTSGEWVYKILDSTISWSAGYNNSSIAVDSNNKVHITYHHNGNNAFNKIFYVNNSNSQWASQVLDTGYRVGIYNNIKIDSNNKIHITYYDYANSKIVYKTNR